MPCIPRTWRKCAGATTRRASVLVSMRSSSAAASCSTGSSTTSHTATSPIRISCSGCRSRNIPGSALVVEPGRRPVLVVYQPDDYWYQPPPLPDDVTAAEFELRIIRKAGDFVAHLPPAGRRVALIGPHRTVAGFVARRAAQPGTARELPALSPRPQDTLGDRVRAAGRGDRGPRPPRGRGGVPGRWYRVRDPLRVPRGLPADRGGASLRRHRRPERARRHAALPAPRPGDGSRPAR